jgi:hypothetical protein
MTPLPTGKLVAAGHNSRLQKAALTLLLSLGSARGSLRSLPLYSLRLSGIMMRASDLAEAASEAPPR